MSTAFFNNTSDESKKKRENVYLFSNLHGYLSQSFTWISQDMKKTIEYEINAFLEIWDGNQIVSFLRDIIPLFELYDVEDETDWVKAQVGELDERNVRLIRTVYLVSKIAENHAGKLAEVKCSFRNLWMKMESSGIDNANS